MGYITGSQKLPGTFYRRPGQQVSGALTMALDEINADISVLQDLKLDFTMVETYGVELESIKVTVELVNQNISVYIGPQETCTHEAKIAAAFNIPMISYIVLKQLSPGCINTNLLHGFGNAIGCVTVNVLTYLFVTRKSDNV
ncbi:GC76C-like protein [Mya arenaria]|uniref:GC76C-like protein n=1 Tax=Mya arenaria TaxID=6604 RepID=A0ABY7DDE9_MYAAR|nr:GC76C-like protein [Mya arenaria]